MPHDTIDISCLVDIDGGKDLALILVKEADKKSVKEIAQFIKEKGSKIKTGKGDADHKKRTKLADFFPAFLVAVLLQVARFLTNKLGISVPALALKRHQFGAGCVTSLGMLGFEDATAPFTGFMDCTFLIAANAVHDEPVVEDGKIVVGRVIYCNFVVDHRYIDGGKAKTFVKAFKHVFENPEQYVDASGPVKEDKKTEWA